MIHRADVGDLAQVILRTNSTRRTRQQMVSRPRPVGTEVANTPRKGTPPPPRTHNKGRPVESGHPDLILGAERSLPHGGARGKEKPAHRHPRVPTPRHWPHPGAGQLGVLRYRTTCRHRRPERPNPLPPRLGPRPSPQQIGRPIQHRPHPFLAGRQATVAGAHHHPYCHCFMPSCARQITYEEHQRGGSP